jgi:hypothetical protein
VAGEKKLKLARLINEVRLVGRALLGKLSNFWAIVTIFPAGSEVQLGDGNLTVIAIETKVLGSLPRSHLFDHWLSPSHRCLILPKSLPKVFWSGRVILAGQ